MAIGTTAAIIGSAAIGAGASVAGSRSAASASQRATDQAVVEQQRQFDLTRQDYQPWMQTGQNALAELSALLGVGYSGAPMPNSTMYASAAPDPVTGQYPYTAAPDLWYQPTDHSDQPGADPRAPAPGELPMSTLEASAPAQASPFDALFNSPEYQFALQQGNRAVNANLAATGDVYGGNALRGISEYNQGLASQQFQNRVNNLAMLSGFGANATNSAASFGANASNNISQAMLANGVNQGNAALSMAGGVGGALNSGITNYLYATNAGMVS